MIKSSKDITLLLIEDDDIDAMTIERSFHKQRIANPIVRAYDGIEALELLRNKTVTKPFIILLDLRMPRMDGVEFLNELRADKEYTDTVVFVLTTSESEQDISDSYHHHVAGYFVKGKAGEQFSDMVSILDNYWKIVHLPNN